MAKMLLTDDTMKSVIEEINKQTEGIADAIHTKTSMREMIDARTVDDVEYDTLGEAIGSRASNKKVDELNNTLDGIYEAIGVSIEEKSTYNATSKNPLKFTNAFTLATFQANTFVKNITCPRTADKICNILVTNNDDIIVDKFIVDNSGTVSVNQNYDTETTWWVQTNDKAIMFLGNATDGYTTNALTSDNTSFYNVGDTVTYSSLGYKICWNIGINYCEFNYDNISKSSKYHNKKLTFIGDSLTYGYIDNEAGRTINPYPSVVAENLSCTCVNLGLNGDTLDGMRKRISQIPIDTDYIFVMGGINSRGKPTGSVTDTGTDTFAGKVYNLIKDISDTFITAKLIFLTPTQIAQSAYTGGIDFEDNVNILIDVCRYYGIPCIDVYGKAGFNYRIESIRNRYYSDQLHLTDYGYLQLGNAITNMLLTN